MILLELFSGTECMSNQFRARGVRTITYDNDPQFGADHQGDILATPPEEFPDCDFIWASVPCTHFTNATVYNNWDYDGYIHTPKSEGAELALRLLDHTIAIIAAKKPKFWFIENPMGVMRKVIDRYFEKHGITDHKRHLITYCQYGDIAMKPEDIWTNCDFWVSRPPCKNNWPCHEAAPRGSPTGTQGKEDAVERGMIPEELCEEIAELCVTGKAPDFFLTHGEKQTKLW